MMNSSGYQTILEPNLYPFLEQQHATDAEGVPTTWRGCLQVMRCLSTGTKSIDRHSSPLAGHRFCWRQGNSDCWSSARIRGIGASPNSSRSSRAGSLGDVIFHARIGVAPCASAASTVVIAGRMLFYPPELRHQQLRVSRQPQPRRVHPQILPVSRQYRLPYVIRPGRSG